MIRLTWDKTFLFIPLVLFIGVLSSAFNAQNSDYQSTTTTNTPSTLELLRKCKTADSKEISRITSQLQQFSSEDFNQEAASLIEGYITSNIAHTSKFIKLAGFLSRCDFIESIRSNYESGTPEKLAVNLALVRCGDSGRIDSFIRNLRKADFGDAFMYEVVPMMIYTRQQKVFRLLEEFVNRKGKSCTSEGESGRPIICAYRIIEQLAPVLRSYPYQVSASGDLATKDYEMALTEIKAWLKNFNGRLPIITNTY